LKHGPKVIVLKGAGGLLKKFTISTLPDARLPSWQDVQELNIFTGANLIDLD